MTFDRHEAECARVEAEFNGTEVPAVTYWRGEPISEMTREELIKAFDELGNLYNQALRINVDAHDLYRGLRGRK